MKKIIFILTFIVLTNFVKAQLLVQVIDVSTGQTKYVPLPTSVISQISKTYVDSGLNTKANFNHQHYATSIIGDALHRFVTDAQITKWNTTTGGSINSLTGDGVLLSLIPSNYNPSLNQGKFNLTLQEFKGVNGTDPRSNVVMSLGYNETSGSDSEIPTEPYMTDGWESHWNSNGTPVFERHLGKFKTLGGIYVRPFSMYEDYSSGLTSIDMQIKQMNFKKFNNAGIDWLSINNDHGNIRMIMSPEVGGASYFEMNGQVYMGTTQFKSKFFITKEINTVNFVNDNGAFVFNQPLSIAGGVPIKLDVDVSGNLLVTANGVTKTYIPK